MRKSICLTAVLALFLANGCDWGGSGGGGSQTPPPRQVPEPISCEFVLRWVLPSEDVNGNPLPSDGLTAAVLHVGRIPMAEPTEVEVMVGVEPYILAHTLTDVSAGLYYYRLTVSNEEGESDYSNEVTKECK